MFLALFCSFVGYLCGSLPTGYLAGKWSGIDVRQYGSGNIGATNVLRVLGKPYGYVVFAVDAMKGFLPVRFAYSFAHGSSASHPEYYAITAAVAAVLGHTFPVWLAFRGGKGVATSAGAVLGLMPLAGVVAVALWVVIFETTKYVSLASVVTALVLPVAVGLLLHLGLVHGLALLYFSIPMALLVVWKHRSNISRIIAGTEPRFTRK